MKAECFQCRFYQLLPDNSGKKPGAFQGRCKRQPPVSVVLNNYPLFVQPLVSAEDWCGEFSASSLMRRHD
jgi:hypothetical protein